MEYVEMIRWFIEKILYVYGFQDICDTCQLPEVCHLI